MATYPGQAVGWYQAGEGAGFIGAIVGAIMVLVVGGMIAPRRLLWEWAFCIGSKVLRRHLFEQRLRVLEVARVEALSEPAVDRSE